MRRPVVGVVVLVAVVLSAIGAFVAWPGGVTPVSRADALEDFRSRPEPAGAEVDPEDGSETSAVLPQPGVYSYAASGQEVVKLGVLPAETRPYPATTTLVVVPDGPDCFTATVNLIEQHTEDTTYCLGADGLRLDAHAKHQRIGPLSPTAAMTCDAGTLVAPGGAEQQLDCTLSLSGGPAQLTAALAGDARVDGSANATVGGEAVDAVALDVTYEVSGDLSGTWREQIWFGREDWLPLRIERDLDLRGLATFTERSTLELTDRSPQR